MPDNRIKNHVYSDKASRRVLAVKRSRDFDMVIEDDELQTHEIIMGSPLFVSEPLFHTYSVPDGLHKVGPPDAPDAPRLAFLAKKVELLYNVLTIVMLTRRQIEKRFTPAFLQGLHLAPASFERTFFFLEEERRVCLSRCDEFWAAFRDSVSAVTTGADLDQLHRRLTHNCNMGVFSVSKKPQGANDGSS
jgi:hypothetical protein